MVDIVHDSSTRNLADDTGEVDGTDAESGGVERDVVVLNKVVLQQADETDENLFNTLWNLTLHESPVLHVLKVKQKDGV